MMSKAEEIAAWMIATGCQDTNSGNYIFYGAEILEKYGEDLSLNTALKDSIVAHLRAQPCVLDVDCDGDRIDIIFGLDYCPNIDEEFWPGMEDPLAP